MNLEQKILTTLGWELSKNHLQKLKYSLFEENHHIGNLTIENYENEIKVEFSPNHIKNSSMLEYQIFFDKPSQNFNVSKSTFKFPSNNEFLSFFDLLGKEIAGQEKIYSNLENA